MTTYRERTLQENEEKMMDIEVHGTTVVKKFSNHIRIANADWDKIKQQVLPVMKQGAKNHGNRSDKD